MVVEPPGSSSLRRGVGPGFNDVDLDRALLMGGEGIAGLAVAMVKRCRPG